MIVKFETETGYHFFDDVQHLSWEWQTEPFNGAGVEIIVPFKHENEARRAPIRVTMFMLKGGFESVNTEGEVYLLNDNGKTIERL